MNSPLASPSFGAAPALVMYEWSLHGLGKWGWVTATLEKGKIPVALFKEWIDESYRAQAPKRLVKQLDA